MPLIQRLIASVSLFPYVKRPDVALYTALSVKAPPLSRVWISGGATHDVLVKEVMNGVFTLQVADQYLIVALPE